jgi:hypothetical protein
VSSDKYSEINVIDTDFFVLFWIFGQPKEMNWKFVTKKMYLYLCHVGKCFMPKQTVCCVQL